MFRSIIFRSSSTVKQSLIRRIFSYESVPERKVAILGAAGGIGQPLALLMKNSIFSALVSRYTISLTHLASLLMMVTSTPDLRLIDSDSIVHVWIHLCFRTSSTSIVVGYMGDENLARALEGADLVIIPAGVPRKPGMTRDDLFNINAGIVKNLCTSIAKYCPHALINMISNPVNSTVPIAAEIFKKAEVNVPVIGGHAGVTILPLFSQATPQANLSSDVLTALTKRTQDGGTEVNANTCNPQSPSFPFFASKVRLGKNGVEEVLDLGPLSDFEKEGLEALKPELKSSIEKGVKFANQ
ncbi:unnamed protein product [Cochlearia groenlandica]